MGLPLAIWWTSETDCLAIGEPSGDEPDLPALAACPDYIRDQYHSRYGRNGRGRLWVADRFGDCHVARWPDTDLARAIARTSGGIVILGEDAPLVRPLPGVVTDFNLEIYHFVS